MTSASKGYRDLGSLLAEALQVGGETTRFDFKESLDYRANGEHKIRLLKAIGAFCNTDAGGFLVVGVTNDRRVVGVPPELAATYDQTPLQRIVGEYFVPPPIIQVRHHEHEGKTLVFVEVAPFLDIPSLVRRHEIQGKERLQDGTLWVRGAAAESTVLTTEVELRRLCDAITKRRASAIAEMVNQQSGVLEENRTRSDEQKALRIVKVEAERMGKHAERLNVGIYQGFAEDYLAQLFRPAMIETSLPAIVGYLEKSQVLRNSLDALRSTAAAADELTARLLERGGALKALVPLVLRVIHNADHVSREIERLLR